MAIELPGEVEWFLGFIGIQWPQVNEDKVREFAEHVKDFAQKIQQAHDAAGSTLHGMGDAYQGASYEALIAKWAQLSNSHMNDLLDACNVVATALEAASDVIIAMKGAAIGELIGLAAAFIADQAAAAATFGAAEAAMALIEEAAKKLINSLLQELEQYVIAQVVQAAIDPLVEAVSRAVSGLVYREVESVLGLSGGGGGVGESFRIDPEALEQHAQTMHDHADTIVGHVEQFVSTLAGVSFE